MPSHINVLQLETVLLSVRHMVRSGVTIGKSVASFHGYSRGLGRSHQGALIRPFLKRGVPSHFRGATDARHAPASALDVV